MKVVTKQKVINILVHKQNEIATMKHIGYIGTHTHRTLWNVTVLVTDIDYNFHNSLYK